MAPKFPKISRKSVIPVFLKWLLNLIYFSWENMWDNWNSPDFSNLIFQDFPAFLAWINGRGQ